MSIFYLSRLEAASLANAGFGGSGPPRIAASLSAGNDNVPGGGNVTAGLAITGAGLATTGELSRGKHANFLEFVVLTSWHVSC